MGPPTWSGRSTRSIACRRSNWLASTSARSGPSRQTPPSKAPWCADQGIGSRGAVDGAHSSGCDIDRGSTSIGNSPVRQLRKYQSIFEPIEQTRKASSGCHHGNAARLPFSVLAVAPGRSTILLSAGLADRAVRALSLGGRNKVLGPFWESCLSLPRLVQTSSSPNPKYP